MIPTPTFRVPVIVRSLSLIRLHNSGLLWLSPDFNLRSSTTVQRSVSQPLLREPFLGAGRVSGAGWRSSLQLGVLQKESPFLWPVFALLWDFW